MRVFRDVVSAAHQHGIFRQVCERASGAKVSKEGDRIGLQLRRIRVDILDKSAGGRVNRQVAFGHRHGASLSGLAGRSLTRSGRGWEVGFAF